MRLNAQIRHDMVQAMANKPTTDGWGTLSPQEPFRNLIRFCVTLDMMVVDDLKALHEKLCEQADDLNNSAIDRAFLEAAAGRVAAELRIDGVVVKRDAGDPSWSDHNTPQLLPPTIGALRRAANAIEATEEGEAATTPSPWLEATGADNYPVWNDDGICSNQDAAFIAAANPQTITALVAEVRRLREALGPFAKIKYKDRNLGAVAPRGDRETETVSIQLRFLRRAREAYAKTEGV